MFPKNQKPVLLLRVRQAFFCDSSWKISETSSQKVCFKVKGNLVIPSGIMQEVLGNELTWRLPISFTQNVVEKGPACFENAPLRENLRARHTKKKLEKSWPAQSMTPDKWSTDSKHQYPGREVTLLLLTPFCFSLKGSIEICGIKEALVRSSMLGLRTWTYVSSFLIFI